MDAHLANALAGREFLLFDGATGTMLQEAGLEPGQAPELLLFERPELVTAVHAAYVAAGAEAVTTCTFGANRRKLPAGVSVAQTYARAVAAARASGARYVAADIGPVGALLEPLGPLTLDECEALLREQAQAVAATDADLVVLETFSDLLELKCAVLAVRDACDLPIVATMSFADDGRTFLGVTPEAAAVTLSSLGVAALGVNCSQGPAALAPVVAAMARHTRVPLVAQANAGLPRREGERTVYDLGPAEYADEVRALLDAGATVLGGCCGTTDAHIARLRALLDARAPQAPDFSPRFCVASASRVVSLPARGHQVACVGERINPTGKKAFRQALAAGDLDRVLDEAQAQEKAGADLLDVNCGVPGVDEPALLERAVLEVQAVCDLPLVIDSSDPEALERACRRYAGKPLVNSVNGSAESLARVLPVARRYGACVVALCLDDDGVPQTATRRVDIARRVVSACEDAGIPAEDVAVDCLAMAASASPDRARPVLDALARVRSQLPVQACLGVSNISFGLPNRPLVNATFLAEALARGLTLPIMDPLSPAMVAALDAHRALSGQDEGCAAFIARHAGDAAEGGAGGGGTARGSAGGDGPASAAGPAGDEAPQDPAELAAWVRGRVLAGRREPVARGVSRLLEAWEPGRVVDEALVAALDEAGRRFEEKSFFLPQLMAAAEAAGAGFERVREALPPGQAATRGTVVLATVQGDVHDIGKNIVGMLLANRGYDVRDLGRDVAPEEVLAAVRRTGARAVGLSALMTTTVPAMEATVALLHREAPEARVFVGGAVLTPELAQDIGADAYAADAAESARLLQKWLDGTDRSR